MNNSYWKHHTDTLKLTHAYLRAHAKELQAAALIILGCIACGLLTLQIPVHKAYLRGRVKTITLRYGSKKPGAWLFMEVEDGRSAVISTRLIHPDLKEGATICLQELTDKIKGGQWFVPTTADRCLPAPAPAAH